MGFLIVYKIFIVEDHLVMRQAYKKYIERIPDMEICAEATSGTEAIQLIDTIDPDIVLLDISLPGKSGIEVLQHFKSVSPQLPVLIVSGHEENVYASAALQLGANGYMDKLGLAKYFEPAIRSVLRGESYIRRSTHAE